MLTDSASSSHRSERVQKKNTSPASSTAPTAMTVARRGRPPGPGRRRRLARGASESTVMESEGNTGRSSRFDAGRSATLSP